MSWSVSQKGARVVLALMIAVCCCLAWAPVAWGAIVDSGVDSDGDLVVIDDVDKDIVHGLRSLGRQQGDADFGRVLVDG